MGTNWLPLRDSLSLMERHIPYIAAGAQYSVPTLIYEGGDWRVVVAQPGRHAYDTKYAPDPRPGGDFVVRVTAGHWRGKPVAHEDIFVDVSEKWRYEPGFMRHWFGPALCAVTVLGECPLRVADELPEIKLPGINIKPLLAASHLLALCEHRRYGKLERVGGGRFLPTRFLLGMLEGCWSAEEMKAFQRRGLKGYRELCSDKLGDKKPPQVRDYVARWRTLPELGAQLELEGISSQA